MPPLHVPQLRQPPRPTARRTHAHKPPPPPPCRFLCREEGTHNDLATLFLSSGHDTIVRLFSVGAVPGQPWVRHFTQVRARAARGPGAGGKRPLQRRRCCRP